MKNFFKVAFVLGLIFMLFFAYKKINLNKKEKSQEKSHYKVEKGSLEKIISLTGNVKSNSSTFVNASYDGFVKKIYVNVGDKVKVGDKIINITQALGSALPSYPIRSSINGTVVSLVAKEGVAVTKGTGSTNYLVRIDDLSEFYISGKVAEMDVVQIKKGNKAKIKLNALYGKTFDGSVLEVELASAPLKRWDNQSKIEYPVLIKLEATDLKIKPGMSAVVDVFAFKKDDVILIKHEYLLLEKGKSFAILKDGEKKEVKLGLRNESHYEIVSGLSEGTELQPINFMELVKQKNAKNN